MKGVPTFFIIKISRSKTNHIYESLWITYRCLIILIDRKDSGAPKLTGKVGVVRGAVPQIYCVFTGREYSEVVVYYAKVTISNVPSHLYRHRLKQCAEPNIRAGIVILT